MEKRLLAGFVLALLSIVAVILLYPYLPGRVASHWNAAGEPDGYMEKSWGAFMLPIISIGLLVIFAAIPKIDPLRKNIDAFKEQYWWFALLMVAFLSYVHMLSLLFNLGYAFDFGRMLAPAFGVLFFYIGVLTENAKRNWFVGIRTPWTLSSDVVWERTHKLGGKLFKAAGAIAAMGVFFSGVLTIWFMVVPVLAVAAYTSIYSYVEYKKLEKH